MRLRLTVLVLMGTVTAAYASFYSGNDLHELCVNNGDEAAGYIVGVSDVLAKPIVRDELEIRVCVPSQATVGQLRDLVCKHLRDMPEDRHFSAQSLVTTALLAAYPCA